MSNRNIDFVVKEFLCTSCGVCSGSCHTGAITMRLDDYGTFTPLIDEVMCDQCGVCVNVCPGLGFDYDDYYRRIYGGLPDHIALGSCIAAYAGHTNDETILECSQSGGFVATLLIYCLERGIIDGAVVSRSRKDSPFEYETFVAHDRRGVLESAGSIYHPVPAAEAAGLLRKLKGKYAFVGTSCQIQGMRKAEKQFKGLEAKVSLYIGLHCLGVFTYHFHEYLLSKTGLGRQEVSRFRLRDKAWKGWPCDMRIQDKTGNIYNLDAEKSRLIPRPYFTNWRCQLCFDKANEFSDVSCGDCRIKSVITEFQENNYEIGKGLSEIVVRSERGRKIIDMAIVDNQFTLVRRSADELASSITVAGKKIGLNAFRAFCEKSNISFPDYSRIFLLDKEESVLAERKKGFKEFLYCRHYYRFFILGRYPLFRAAVRIFSFKTLKKMKGNRERGLEFVVNRGAEKLRIQHHE